MDYEMKIMQTKQGRRIVLVYVGPVLPQLTPAGVAAGLPTATANPPRE